MTETFRHDTRNAKPLKPLLLLSAMKGKIHIMGLAKDLKNVRFSRLVANKCIGVAPSRKMLWECLCDCGKIVVTESSSLINGNTKSCGCLQKEVARESLLATTKTHGDTVKGVTTSEYRAWQSMRQRCMNPNQHSFRLWGGRGITICDRWSDFSNFLSDMGRKPSPRHSIDRINNDGNYEPSNCRWATQKEQIANRRPFRRRVRNSEGVLVYAEPRSLPHIGSTPQILPE